MLIKRPDSRTNPEWKFINLLEVLNCSITYDVDKDKDDAKKAIILRF